MREGFLETESTVLEKSHNEKREERVAKQDSGSSTLPWSLALLHFYHLISSSELQRNQARNSGKLLGETGKLGLVPRVSPPTPAMAAITGAVHVISGASSRGHQGPDQECHL